MCAPLFYYGLLGAALPELVQRIAEKHEIALLTLFTTMLLKKGTCCVPAGT